MQEKPANPLLVKINQVRRSMPNDLLAQISNEFSGGDCDDHFVARSLDLAQRNFEGLLTQIEVLLRARTDQ